MRYVWNDFAPVNDHNGMLHGTGRGKPCGTLRMGNEEIQPGAVFEASPKQIESMGARVAAKCITVEEWEKRVSAYQASLGPKTKGKDKDK